MAGNAPLMTLQSEAYRVRLQQTDGFLDAARKRLLEMKKGEAGAGDKRMYPVPAARYLAWDCSLAVCC